MYTVEGLIQEIETKYEANAQYILGRTEMEDELDYIGRQLAKEEQFDGFFEYICKDALKKANDLHERLLTPATAKVGDGATIHLWSDAHACTIIKVTKSTVTVRRDKATLDPGFKPEFILGGFCAHCTNQDEQSYTYEEDPNGEVSTFHWSRKYGTYGRPGNLRLTRGRREFHDYNF